MHTIYTFSSSGNHNDTTNLVLDHFTYWFDLDDLNNQTFEVQALANQSTSLNMSLEYSATQDLQLPDMSPRSWWEYVKRLAKSKDRSIEVHIYHALLHSVTIVSSL